VKALDRKLVRDVWQQRAQVVTVALVLASAIAGFAGSFGTYYSLVAARAGFYASARFADVFAAAKRAPAAVAGRLGAVPGVARADTTVVFDATLDVPGVAEPVVGRLIGLPDDPADALDEVVLRRGGLPAGPHDVVVSEGFAIARNLVPGARIGALVNGRRTTLAVSGIGLSPEYIYATAGGAFPDDRNFAVVWMPREPLARAYDMEGAFNHAAIRLAPGASAPAVMAAVDALLEPYGGLKAYDRSEQPSHRILDQEIAQWRVMGTLLPSIFLGVAAFLINVVQNRRVRTQREQIAALKALGYDNATLGRHYLLQALAVLALGLAFGIPVAYWFGSAVTGLYAAFFHFPSYRFAIPVWVHVVSGGIAALAIAGGAMGAIRHVVRLAPAEAMRPPYPGRFRRTLLERLGLGALAGPALRMTLRNLERRPGRAALTVIGIASAMAIVVVGLFWRDALDYMIDVQFESAQRADAQIAFVEPLGAAAMREVARLPGVLDVAGERTAPVELVAGHRRYRTALLGIPAESDLRRPLDAALRPIQLPPEGMLLTDRLAQRLALRPGDGVRVEFLTGKRRIAEVAVAGIVNDLIGLNAYMELRTLNRLAGDGDVRTGAAVRLADAAHGSALYERLKALPRVATVASKAAMLQNFRDTSARNILFFTSILTGFAAVIAIGVVYNHARIALQERTWELASLRVLGFTRTEVSVFLLGELAIEALAALPLGALLGFSLAWLLVHQTHSDLIAVPVVIAPRTYGYAALAIVVAAVASALVVRRRIDRLDMVAALKTRE
jgi:putative ABC transport system permease protein